MRMRMRMHRTLLVRVPVHLCTCACYVCTVHGRLSPGSAPPEKGAWWDCSMDPSPGQEGCAAVEGPSPRLHPHVSSLQPCVSRCDAPEESLGEDEQEVEGESLGSDDDLDESDEGDEAGVTAAAEAAAPAVAPTVAACAEVDLSPDHVHDPEQADDDDDDDELLAMLD